MKRAALVLDGPALGLDEGVAPPREAPVERRAQLRAHVPQDRREPPAELLHLLAGTDF